MKKKQRTENWPVLEQALTEWFAKEQGNLPIAGDLVRARAHQLWHSLVQYEDRIEPLWSDSWLSRFCRRYSIYSCRPCLRRPRCTRGASAVQLNVYCSLMIIELVMLSVST
jgi:hypothetical protein